MSSLSTQARTLVPRSARAAVERARLTVVPAKATTARKAPFAVLVLAVLAAGVVGLLMFNTQMQQASFYASSLQSRADALSARQQSLQMELDALRDPQRLAAAGKKLGLVAPSVPAFVSLADGRIIGGPTPATADDAVRIKPYRAVKPAAINPTPIVVRVHPPVTKPHVGAIPATQPTRASASPGTGTGRNGAGVSHPAHRPAPQTRH